MPRITSTNTFEGGMVKDMHPMLVPNNIMTDCLNGTLITYNGNEFALQNDMGNYRFNEGGLSSGFVPVGMKEYGGILYIISYNPTKDMVEVGSFPSQKTIFNTKHDDSGNKTLDDIKLVGAYNFYTELIKQSHITLLSSKDESFFLSPGDKYKLSIDGGTVADLDQWQKDQIWKHLHPYVLTDENKLFDIQGYIKVYSSNITTNREDYVPISWDIPGWLAIQQAINVMDVFDVYFSEMDPDVKTHPENADPPEKIIVKPAGDLKVQSFWNSKIYGEDLLSGKITANLVYFLYTPTEEGEIVYEKPIEGIKNNYLNYNSIQSSIYTTIPSEKLGDYEYIVPALEIGEQYLIYDQFATRIEREPKEYNWEDITIDQDYFKYLVDDNSATITFRVNAFPGAELEYQL